jgi:hypothetical protein
MSFNYFLIMLPTIAAGEVVQRPASVKSYLKVLMLAGQRILN